MRKILFLFLIAIISIRLPAQRNPEILKMKDVAFENGKYISKSTKLPFTGTLETEDDFGCGYKETFPITNGNIDGIWVIRIKDWIRSEGFFKNGVGILNTFFEKENKLETIEPYKKNLLHGNVECFYQNGSKSSTDFYIYGIQQGKSISWFESGNKMSEVDYVNGKKHGKECFWANKGFLLNERNWSHGKPNGNWLGWNLDGSLSMFGYYNQGKGFFFGYYPGGNVYHYEKSESYGSKTLSIYWYENGNPMSYIELKCDLKHGTVKEWDKKGNLTKHAIYKNGKSVKSFLKK